LIAAPPKNMKKTVCKELLKEHLPMMQYKEQKVQVDMMNLRIQFNLLLIVATPKNMKMTCLQEISQQDTYL
jgi:hypothetical protein